MRNLTIRERVLASFGAILAVLIIVGAVTYARTSSIERQAIRLDSQVMPGLINASEFKDALTYDYVISFRHAFELDAQKREAFARQMTVIRRQLDVSYRQIVDEAVTDPAKAEAMKAVFGQYVETRNEMDRVVKAGASNTALINQSGARFDQIYSQTYEKAQEIEADHKRAGRAVAAEIYEDLGALRLNSLYGLIFVFAMAFISGILLLRAITRPLGQLTAIMAVMREGDFTQRMPLEYRDEFGTLAEGFNSMADEVMALVGQVQRSGVRVSTSMTEIAATAKQQQATATEVAATTTEIGATSREITATSKELARTMNEVSSVAEQAASLASTSQSELAHMEETMGQIMDASSSINAKLSILNEKAGSINQVVTTITKVADQTNLLSLNAAIEAEKAGEYGRGFAVVSAEIRRLADQTAVATYDIEQIVTEIQAAVAAGVMGMDKFSEEVRRGMYDVQQIGGKLSDVIEHVRTLAPRFEAVNDGMEAQSTGAEQISEALQQLSEATHQTVESLRQSSSAIEELSHVSGSLHNSISRFKLAIG